MAKGKFDFLKSVNYGQDEQGRIRMFSDDQIKQFNAENEAKRKIDDANRLKQQIQSETEAVILESQKEKAGFERMAAIGKGAQAVIDPRMWAKGTVGLGKMIFGQTIETTVTGGKAIGEQNAATNLYTQSKDLADQAAKIVKTDRPQAEALLRQSQALIEEANKFSQGEATKKIMGADDKLTGKEIFAKSALTAIELGSLAPIGSVAKGSFMLAKTVPPAVQGTKTVAVGNAITRGLGLGDIYQVTKTGLQQGLKQEVQQTIAGQARRATYQSFITAGLIEMADDDGVNNYWGSLTTTAVGAFGLTLSFGYAGRVFGSAINEGVSGVTQQLNKKSAAAVTDLTGAIPVPKEQAQIGTAERLMLPEATQATTTIGGQQVGLPTSPYSKLGAFNPETDIPMVDLTETIKPNNIDFNPDSVISINATRKAVDDLALLNGNEVGGKKLKINTDDPKFKEIYNNQIKPLIDKINAVDEVAPVSEVSAQQIVEVQSQLDNLKSTEQEVAIGLSQDEMQLEVLLDELKTHPGKALHKYANKKEGKLPEITGKGSKYAKQGDSIMTELGFTSDDEAQDAYQSWLGLIRQRDSLKANIKESSTFLKDITKEQQTLQKQLEETQPPIESYEQPQINKIPTEVKGEVSFQDLDEVKIKLPTGDKTYKLQYKATDAQKELISKLEKEKNVLFELKNKRKEKFKNIDTAAIEKINQKIKNLENKDTSPEWLDFKKLDDELNSIAEDSTITDAEISDLADKRNAAYNKAIDKPKYNVLYKQIDKIEQEYNQANKQMFDKEKKLKKLAKQYYDTNPPSSKEETSINNPNPINFDDWYQKYYTFDREPADAYSLQFNEKDFNAIKVRQRINANKIPAEEVELEVSKIYSELENAGINITPEKVRHTPNIDKIDEKQAKGEQFTPEEFDKGMKEYVNSTGKTEVIDGVQEELTGPMKKSAYVERLNRENPGLNLTSVEYQSAVVKDLKAVADDLIENNFDEAARIAKNINANSNLQEIKTAELYINKLIELGKKDELAQVYHTFSRNATSMGQKNGILQEKKIGSPQYAIKQAQDSRTNKLKPKIDKEVAKVKQQMSSIAVDQTFMSDILDNITCR